MLCTHYAIVSPMYSNVDSAQAGPGLVTIAEGRSAAVEIFKVIDRRSLIDAMSPEGPLQCLRAMISWPSIIAAPVVL